MKFQDLWENVLKAKAVERGVKEDEMYVVRTAAQKVAIGAGWLDKSGNMQTVSAKDMANCVDRCTKALVVKADFVVASRKVTMAAGSSPTKSQVLSAFAPSPDEIPVSVSAGKFSPIMASPGDTCPNCQGSMQTVNLTNNKLGLFCSRDRVCLPLKA